MPDEISIDNPFKDKKEASGKTAPPPSSAEILYGALTLSQGGINEYCKSEKGQIVLILGGIESGKTGLIAGLYVQLRKAPFNGWRFARSNTLKGLEIRAHHLSTASNREKPQLDRTNPSSETVFLHLGIQSAASKEPFDIFLTDMRGETTDDARDSSGAIRLTLLEKVVDHIVITLDGGKFLDPITRNIEIDNARHLFLRLVHAGFLNKKVNCQLVLTKLDLLVPNETQRTILGEMLSQITFRFTAISSEVNKFGVFHVAACPHNDFLNDLDQFPKLISEWLLNSRVASTETSWPWDKTKEIRSIDLFDRI